MKLASLLFFGLLYYAHQVSESPYALSEPMCSLRLGTTGAIGYALFFAIALVGVLYIFALKRAGLEAEAANTVGAGVLLLIIAATPSHWAIHTSSAFVLLAFNFTYYAMLLHRSGANGLAIAHLAVPMLLAFTAGFQSYGMWQKSLICYLIAAATVHHHVVCRMKPETAPAADDLLTKRRTIYRIDPDKPHAERREPDRLRRVKPQTAADRLELAGKPRR